MFCFAVRFVLVVPDVLPALVPIAALTALAIIVVLAVLAFS